MNTILGGLETGLLFVVSAPAGTGKTTLTQMLVQEFSSVVQSVSYTTRSPRKEEIPGIHYNYIDRETFERKVKENAFLEYAELYGEYYLDPEYVRLAFFLYIQHLIPQG